MYLLTLQKTRNYHLFFAKIHLEGQPFSPISPFYPPNSIGDTRTSPKSLGRKFKKGMTDDKAIYAGVRIDCAKRMIYFRWNGSRTTGRMAGWMKWSRCRTLFLFFWRSYQTVALCTNKDVCSRGLSHLDISIGKVCMGNANCVKQCEKRSDTTIFVFSVYCF